MDTYFCFQMLMTGLVFPVGAGWAWNGGWLQNLGYLDAAGSGCVHVVGGTAAFWGTLILGPRIGFFGRNAKSDNAHLPHDMEMTKDQINTSRHLKSTHRDKRSNSQDSLIDCSFEDSLLLTMDLRLKIFRK